MGIKSEALGFVAGFTGEAIENGMAKDGIKTDFVHLNNGFSRINVKIQSSFETEINGQGPEISEENIEELFKKLNKIQDGEAFRHLCLRIFMKEFLNILKIKKSEQLLTLPVICL